MVKKADEIAPLLADKIIIQTGYTKYEPKNCKHFSFIDQVGFEDLCRKASVVITHGGIGSIMTPLKLGKPTIVVPRIKNFGEHTDDHQLQITKEMEREKKIIAVYDINDLEKMIRIAKKQRSSKINKRGRIQSMIQNFLEAENKRLQQRR